MGTIKVMIVDDSALVRQTLTKILDSDPEIEVVDTAADPIFAAKKMIKNPPDVITLDMEMPRMNGITFLSKIMAQYPVPVVIISSLTTKNAELSMKALEIGAVDVITKPKIANKEFFEESKIRIIDAVKAAAKTDIKKNEADISVFSAGFQVDDLIHMNQSMISLSETTDKVIAIGASTGGTSAILRILSVMPPDCPGIVIVQHMPEMFTKTFAERMNSICKINIKEAEPGDTITSGKVLIAPGNKHMLVNKSGAKYYVDIVDGPLVNRHRPSVDMLFRSTAQFVGKNAVGIILTGMGDDGANGLLEMKQAGAYTIAQDEGSSAVYGMPKAAIDLGAANKVLNIDDMAGHILGIISGKKKVNV